MIEPQISYFGRLCVILLSIEWILFGSMHFSLLPETMAQIPGFVPETLKLPTAVITGMLEVAIGTLVLVPRARRYAAIGSLVLLLVYVPAVYHILAYDAGTPAAAGAKLAFRVALVPNNIFLAICSVFILEHPGLRLAGPGRPPAPAPAPMLSARVAAGRLNGLIAVLLLLSNCAGFLTLMMALPRPGLAYLWAMMCIALGALIGFLFGVPRVNPAFTATARFLPNTNVEAVSDWLTKILVGVGLVNFTAIGNFVDGQAAGLAIALGAAKPLAVALIMYFFLVGVIQGYILTRAVLSGLFSRLDPGRDVAGAE